MIADALRLSVYFGEGVSSGGRLASDALMDALAARGIEAAAMLRGIEGFGLNRRIHAERFPDISTDLPLLAVAVDRTERVLDVLDDVDRAVPRGLVTLEPTRLATGIDVAGAEPGPGPGRAAKLTVYCDAAERIGRRPAYRVAVDVLRGAGVPGAIVLPAADGLIRGARRRVRLFSSAGGAMATISIAPREVLPAALAELGGALRDPVVTVDPIALLKHDGERLEPLPIVPDGPPDGRGWQAIALYTRRTATHRGHTLFAELTRRLRKAGASGATTVLGDWGFSSDEPPHGDRFGRIASHRPTYTVWVDRPETVAKIWPVVDELTSVHGIVTCRSLPTYRERAAQTVRGHLELSG